MVFFYKWLGKCSLYVQFKHLSWQWTVNSFLYVFLRTEEQLWQGKLPVLFIDEVKLRSVLLCWHCKQKEQLQLREICSYTVQVETKWKIETNYNKIYISRWRRESCVWFSTVYCCVNLAHFQLFHFFHLCIFFFSVKCHISIF